MVSVFFFLGGTHLSWPIYPIHMEPQTGGSPKDGSSTNNFLRWLHAGFMQSARQLWDLMGRLPPNHYLDNWDTSERELLELHTPYETCGRLGLFSPFGSGILQWPLLGSHRGALQK